MSSITQRLSPDGVFSNGVRAPEVVQLILDYEETAPIQDVADYFKLSVEEVSAALEYCDRHYQRLRDAGWLVR